MPGIVGLISNDGTNEGLSNCLKSLCHFDWLSAQAFSPSTNVALGAVYRKHRSDQLEFFEDKVSGTCVVLSGAVFRSAPHSRRLTAIDLFDSFEDGGLREWTQFDGSFVCAIYDGRRSKFHLINDRLGTLPVYYASRRNLFAFAPEAKAIFTHSAFKPSFDTSGVIAFLSAGYCLGAQTLFEGVSVLLPGSVITINVHTLSVETHRYWNLEYDPRPELKVDADAESALYHAVVESHRLHTCDGPQRVSILLSGGWDSRGMLEFLETAGGHFDTALSWGYRDDIPESDVAIAKELASEFQVPFDFTAYGTDTLVENAESWCYISELANDNFGWYAEGAGVLINCYDKSIDSLFVGDEIWGWGNDVSNEDEGRAEVIPPHLPESVKGILNEKIVRSAPHEYETAIDVIMRECESDRPNDRKDYLYFYGRVARFIFALGYFKELAIPIRRPFLSRGVIDVISGLSQRQRINKRIYRSMLRRFAPRATKASIAYVSSLPDWNYDLRHKDTLRDFMADLLDPRILSAGPLAEALDVQAVAELQRREFARFVTPVRRSPDRVRNLMGNFLRSGPLGYLVKRKLLSKTMSHPEASDFKVLQRIALLSLLSQLLPGIDRT